MRKKVLAVLLVMTLSLSLFPLSVAAEQTGNVQAPEGTVTEKAAVNGSVHRCSVDTNREVLRCLTYKVKCRRYIIGIDCETADNADRTL